MLKKVLEADVLGHDERRELLHRLRECWQISHGRARVLGRGRLPLASHEQRCRSVPRCNEHLHRAHTQTRLEDV
eukprot:16449451-Heterocapsa_arctica.AAC.1